MSSVDIVEQIVKQIAKELKVEAWRVQAAVGLMDGGATVPFIARYRKEQTGSLDDTQLRDLEKRLGYLREFEARKASILASIDKQGLLTAELTKQIHAATTLTGLEDLYLPYKPKRKTKATAAREAGLEPLAEKILASQSENPETLAAGFLNPEHGIEDADAALNGAKEILIERFCEDAALLKQQRYALKQSAVVRSEVVKKYKEQAEKFEDYFDYTEQFKKIPSHRALALFRGQAEGFLRVKLLENLEGDASEQLSMLKKHFGITDSNAAAYPFLNDAAEQAWQKLLKKFQTDLFGELRGKAEEEAVAVFGENLRDLLLAAPAGHKATIGLDPGIRTGVKVAVVDQHGKLLETAVIYPFAPQNRVQESLAALAVLVDKYKPELVAIGNGTGSRETEKLMQTFKENFPNFQLTTVVVSEAGASVYSASELASKEFPKLDVSLRGAVSIARRLQDPLSELVKIEPKAIGVGQYQHDVNQGFLNDALSRVVEDCVNSVGVDLNSASVELLSYVSGLNHKVASQIVEERNAKGAYASREQLKKVKGLGAKTFEQAAGFLRIANGDNPLDASAVHPESYALVESILKQISASVKEVMGRPEKLKDVNAKQFVSESFGEQTVQDVLTELEKPGRDPRPEFKTARFKSGVKELHDLREGMMLEGVVSNVTNFGAFVDIGVHQDGLVHISALADQFVDDPRKVVRTGQVVKVKVLEVDMKRKRISLSMRMEDKPEPKAAMAKGSGKGSGKPAKKERNVEDQIKNKLQRQDQKKGGKPQEQSALAAAFAKALEK